jgi:cell division protein FtsB
VRSVTVVLLGLIALTHYELWLGKASYSQRAELRAKLQAQQSANTSARLRNAQVLAELRDLTEGLEMVEEQARLEQGMLRPNEILVHVNPATKH